MSDYNERLEKKLFKLRSNERNKEFREADQHKIDQYRKESISIPKRYRTAVATDILNNDHASKQMMRPMVFSNADHPFIPDSNNRKYIKLPAGAAGC